MESKLEVAELKMLIVSLGVTRTCVEEGWRMELQGWRKRGRLHVGGFGVIEEDAEGRVRWRQATLNGSS